MTCDEIVYFQPIFNRPNPRCHIILIYCHTFLGLLSTIPAHSLLFKFDMALLADRAPTLDVIFHELGKLLRRAAVCNNR